MLQYLKICLKSRAAAIVSHLGTNAKNYQAVYYSVMRRYDSKRKIIGELYDKLIDLPIQTAEAGANFRNMHDTTENWVTYEN